MRHKKLLGLSYFACFASCLQFSSSYYSKESKILFCNQSWHSAQAFEGFRGFIQLGANEETAQDLGQSARIKYRTSFVNFYYAILMKTKKEEVKQAK